MRDKIKLISTEGTGHFYTTTKNKRTMPEKMEIKKFDPVVRKHVIYKEAKIKQPWGSKNLFQGTLVDHAFYLTGHWTRLNLNLSRIMLKADN